MNGSIAPLTPPLNLPVIHVTHVRHLCGGCPKLAARCACASTVRRASASGGPLGKWRKCVAWILPPPACQKRRTLAPTTAKTDEEPVFFFEPPKALVEELLHTAQAKGVIDLTAGAGTWAIACLEMGLPYLGVVLTEMHLTELLAHLTKQAAFFGNLGGRFVCSRRVGAAIVPQALLRSGFASSGGFLFLHGFWRSPGAR